MEFLHYLNIEITNIDNEEIDVQLQKFKNQINDKFLEEFKNLFKSEYKGDFDDYENVIKFIDSEIEYIDKLMSFTKEIELKDVLKKTNLITLRNYFNIKLEIKKLERDKWTLIEYKDNNFNRIKTLLNYYLVQTYTFFVNTYNYIKQ